MLYIVGTPIGNLKDITLRAIETLKSVDIILAEDTRRTKILLDHYGIQINTSDVRLRPRRTSDVDNQVKQLVSFHEHASQEKIDWIIRELESGKDIVLVSDAGTPGVADPGGRLVSAVISSALSVKNEKSLKMQRNKNQELRIKNNKPLILDSRFIIPVPGVSALTTIMSVSGAQNEPCLFLGYLPKKKGRQTMLKKLEALTVRKMRKKSLIKTIVLFESPQRIKKTFKDLYQAFGADIKVVVGRELTKQFEEIVWATLGEAIRGDWPTKGEYTLLIKIS